MAAPVSSPTWALLRCHSPRERARAGERENVCVCGWVCQMTRDPRSGTAAAVSSPMWALLRRRSPRERKSARERERGFVCVCVGLSHDARTRLWEQQRRFRHQFERYCDAAHLEREREREKERDRDRENVCVRVYVRERANPHSRTTAQVSSPKWVL